MGSYHQPRKAPQQSESASPPLRFTLEAPTVQPQIESPQQALPKFNPDTSIFETDFDNPYRSLFGHTTPAPPPLLHPQIGIGAVGWESPSVVRRDVDPNQVESGQTLINPQDIKLEQIAHGLIYKNQLNKQAHEWLSKEGFHPWWHPNGNITKAGSGVTYGLLIPNEMGKASGKVPVLAFRGTHDLATAWQDLDFNSPGHGGIQPFLKDFSLIAHLVMKYGYPKMDVTGHSLGGALAQHFTGTNPGIVRRLVTFQSAGPNGAQYKDNIAQLEEEDRPEVVHHVSKGDIVDIIGGDHLEGMFFEHNIQTSGLPSVSTLARLGQSHTAQLLNTKDIRGDETLATGSQTTGKHKGNIKVHTGSRPYGAKSKATELGRMALMNKITGVPMAVTLVIAGLAISAPEILMRLGVKGIKKMFGKKKKKKSQGN